MWAVWLLTTATGAVWVARYGRHLPYSDELAIIERLVGRSPVTFDWLISIAVEVHRPLVPRLITLGLARASGGDFVWASWLNLALSSAAAAIGILVLRRVRGTTRLMDAIFPLTLMSLVQPGLRWGWEINHVLVSVIMVAFLLLVIRFRLESPPRWLWFMIVSAALLMLSSAPGVAAVPGILAWLALCSWHLRTTEPRKSAGVAAAVGGLAAALIVYVVTIPGAATSQTTSPRSVLSRTLRLIGNLGGPHADRLWPWSAVAVLAAVLATAALIILRVLRPSEGSGGRDQALALLCSGMAVFASVVAIAVGRGASQWDAQQAVAYVALMVPVPLWVYLSWERLSPRWGSVAGAVVLVAAVVAYGLTIDYVPRQQARRVALEHELRRQFCSVTEKDLGGRYRYIVLETPTDAEIGRIARVFRMMRTQDLGPVRCVGGRQVDTPRP